MFSPKAFVQDVIASNLSEWVENIEEHTLNLGLLEGDLQLSNLVVKKFNWIINQNLSLSLEHGTIDKFNVQVPWLHLHTGQVNLFVDTIVLVFRLNILDHNTETARSNDNFTRELKMDLLRKEELRLADDGNRDASVVGKKSWMSRTFRTFLKSLLAKVAAKFSLTVTNIKVSIVLPLPANDCAQLKLNINSLAVSSDMSATNTSSWNTQKGQSSGMYEFFLSKKLSVRGLSLSLNKITKPQSQKEVANMSKCKTHDNLGVLLNPCNISSQVYGRKDKQSELHLHNLRTLVVHVNASNIEWTPSCDQLFLIKDIFMNLEQESIKYQYQVIRALLTKKAGGPKATIETGPSESSDRPSISESVAALKRSTTGRKKHHSSRKNVDQKMPFNPREVWVFAIRAILVMVKEKRAGGRFRPQLRSGMERLGLRRQYIGFYRRVLNAKLYGEMRKDQEPAKKKDNTDCSVQLDTDSKGNSVTSSAPALEAGLTTNESQRFAELHDLFSLSDLILFRATVLQEFKNKGVTAVELRHALTNSRAFPFWTAWFGKGAKENATSKDGMSAKDKGSSSSTTKNDSDETRNFTFDVTLSLARLSIAVFDNPLQPHHPNNRRRMSDAGHLNFATPISHRPTPAMPPNGHNTAPVGRGAAGDRPSTRRANHNYTAGMASRISKYGSNAQTPINFGRSTVLGSAAPTAMTAVETAMVLPKQCFALVFYGIHTAVEWGGDLDKMMNLSLGSFKCFGHRGAEIASCGGDPNYWLEYSYADAHAGRAPYNGDLIGLDTTKAVYFSFKWCQTAVMTPYELAVLKKQQRDARRRNRRNRTSSGEASDENELAISSDSDSQSSSVEGEDELVTSTAAPRHRPRSLQRAAEKYSAFDGDDSLSSRAFNSAYRSLMRASNKHLVVEVDISFVKISWHRKSVLFLTDLYHHILPQSATGSSRTIFQHLKMKAAQLSYFRAVRGIVDVPAKVSIEAKAQGATIRVPIQAQRETSTKHTSPRYNAYGTSEKKPLDRSASVSDPAAMNSDSKHYVELSFRKVTLYSGDYLTSEMNEIARQSQHLDRSHSRSGAPSGVPNSSQQFSFGVDADVVLNGLSEYDPDISPESSVHPKHSMRNNRGVYTDFNRDRSNASDPPEYEEETPSQLTPREKIRELVLALQNTAVRPMAFCVSHIELAIVGYESAPRLELTPAKGNNNKSPYSLHKIFSPPDSIAERGPQVPDPLLHLDSVDSAKNRRVLTVVPWVIQGVISPNVIHNDASFTQLRLDVICSAFQLQISTQDILKLINMGKETSAACASVVASVTAGPVAPRVSRLASLSCMFIDVELENVRLEYLQDTDTVLRSNSSAISASLRTYGTLLQTRGRYSFVALSRRAVVTKQLHNLSVKDSAIKSVLDRFETDVLESHQEVQYIADTHTIELFAESGRGSRSNSSAQDSNNQSIPNSIDYESSASPIPQSLSSLLLSVELCGVRVLRHDLTYDHRTMVSMRTLMLLNNERIALLSIDNVLRDRLEHFPHLEKEAETEIGEDLRGINIETPISRNQARRRSSPGFASQRRDSAGGAPNRAGDRGEHIRRRPFSSRRSSRYHSGGQAEVKSLSPAIEAEIPVSNTPPTYQYAFKMDRFAQDCCLVLQYEEKDLNWSFGTGGNSVECMYNAIGPSLYGSREGILVMYGCQVDFQFSTSSLIQIFDQVMRDAATVEQHLVQDSNAVDNDDSNRRSHATSRRRSSVGSIPKHLGKMSMFAREKRRQTSTAFMRLYNDPSGSSTGVYVHQYERNFSLKSEVRALVVTMSCDGQDLARLSLYRNNCTVLDLTNCSGSRTVTASVHSLSLLDLTELGALHSEVLWKQNDNQSLHAVLEAIKAVEKEHLSAAANSENIDYLYRESFRREIELFKQEKARISDAPPVLIFSLVQSEKLQNDVKHEHTLINMELDSLRVCLLYRFLIEVTIFVTDKFSVPLHKLMEDLDECKRRASLVPETLRPMYSEGDSDQSGDAEVSLYSGGASDLELSSQSDSRDSEEDFSWSEASGSDADISVRFANPRRGGRSGETSTGSAFMTPAEAPVDRASKSETASTEVRLSQEYIVTVTNLACLIPRNSNSRDLVSVTIGSGKISIGRVAEMFPIPEKDGIFPGLNPDESDAIYPLHLDIVTNMWRYRPSLATERARQRAANQSSLDNCVLRTFYAASPGTRLRARAESVNSVGSNCSGAVGRRLSGFAVEDDGDIFYDVDPEWSSTYDQSNLKDWGDTGASRWRPSLDFTAPGTAGESDTWWLQDEEDERERLFLLEELSNSWTAETCTANPCHRISVETSDTHIFVTFAGPSNFNRKDGRHPAANTQTPRNQSERKRGMSETPLFSTVTNNGTSTPVVDTTEHKVFLEIQDGGLVNKFRRKATGNVGVWPVNQTWKKITAEAFNLLVVYDTTEEKSKMLFGDTSDMSVLHLNMSQSEMYLLIGVWFDNMFEQPQFGAEDAPLRSTPSAATEAAGGIFSPVAVTNTSLATAAVTASATAERPGSLRAKEPVRFNLKVPDEDNPSPRSGGGRSHVNSDATSASQHHNETASGSRSNHNNPPAPPQYSKYGSKEYLQYLHERFSTFELVFMKAEIRVQCSIDSNYFNRDIPNHAALANLESTEPGTSFCHSTHHHHTTGSHRAGYGIGTSASKLPRSMTGSGEDKNGFSFYNISTEAHTPSFAKKILYSRWVNKLLPIAEVSLSGMLIHIQCDNDVTHFSLGAGKCEVYDMRYPQQMCASLAMRVAVPSDPTTLEHVHLSSRSVGDPNHTVHVGRRRYGYSDFDFGFDLVPSDTYAPPDLPVKISFVLSEETNWMTLNVGLDMLDLNIHNLDLVNLLSDYFSCYFRFPEYGHPGVQAYDRLTAPYIIPYGGVDTRVFAFRPHVSLLKTSMSMQSPALLLETEAGVYFRYTLDTESTVKMDLNIFSLAVVLVKRYRPPSQYRGIRGSSGSGKGVRTLVEYLNLNLSYHFIVTGNNLDLKILVSGPDDEDADEESSQANALNESTIALNNSAINSTVREVQYVDLHSEQLNLGSSPVPHPHSVFPLVTARTDFTPHSCDIVASYEDLTFCISLVNKFLQFEEGLPATDSNSSKKGLKTSADSGGTEEEEEYDTEEESPTGSCSIFSVLVVAGIRVMIVDNVLGLHLPLVQIFVEEIQNTFVRDDHANMMISCAATANDSDGFAAQFPDLMSSRQTRRFTMDGMRRPSESRRRDSLTQELVRLKSIAQYQMGRTGTPSVFNSASNSKAMKKQEMMTFSKGTFWAEYFNNMRKCWEPLLEKVVATLLYEKSMLRGTGLTFRTASAVHANISGAFFRTLNDILTTLRSQKGSEEETADGVLEESMKLAGQPTPGKRRIKRGSIHAPEANQHDYQYDDHHQNELSVAGRQIAATSISDKNNRPLSRRRSRRSDSSFNRRSSINQDADDGSSITTATTAQRRLDHVPSNPLGANFRVGFSIQNLTGQPVRYLQQWEGGRRTVQYINNNERGLLNFVASKTLIRNNQVIEETFDVQMEKTGNNTAGTRNRRKAVGNRVALQVSGYRWLHAVQADELGVHYEELYSVLGRLHVSQVYKNWKIVNSLKLMVEVMPYCGGRMLRLRSVFTIKNNTRHRLKILAKEGASAQVGTYTEASKNEEEDAPFLLDSGENFYVPLALLRRSVLASAGKSLGYLYLCPADLAPIEEELVYRPNSQPGSVEYTTDPINLYQTVVKSNETAEAEEREARRLAADSDLDVYYKPNLSYAKENYTQIVCHINPKLKGRYNGRKASGGVDLQNNVDYQQQQDQRRIAARAALNKLPPFCYCVEVQSGSDYSSTQKLGNQSALSSISSRFFSNSAHHAAQQMNSPVNFTITIHPPIVLENLLPCGGIFELVHATQKRVLWSSYIAAGTVKPVHTVTLEEPLLLLINLKYCRSSEGALIHQPRRSEGSEGIVGKMQRTLEGLLEDNLNASGESNEDITSIVLTDTVGQRIRLNVENTLGGGGQRQVAVYCPYWVVNTSQYSLRIMEEGINVLPAGTVTAQKDGTRPVPHSGLAFVELLAASDHDRAISHDSSGSPNILASSAGILSPNAHAVSQDSFYHSAKKSTKSANESHNGAVFPGCYGPLHSVNNKEFTFDSTLGHQLQELNFNEIVDLSYMFNYIEPQGRLGKKRVKVQLDDTNWSRPFSLDSVGVNQMLTVNNNIRGCMELGFKISVAPGRLAKYTKIVRFLPRFSIVNKLPVALKILQPTGFAGQAAEQEISAEKVRPYHLPAMFGERQISLLLDGGWHRSVAFNIDQIGVFNMQVKRRINLATIQHVNTRGAPEFQEILPPLRTLGVYFETDWGEENIVVKSLQKGSYAANNTDIKIGDVLLSIDNEAVDGKTFELAMVLIRNKLASASGCAVRFRTVEEKIRLIRESALITTKGNQRTRLRRPLEGSSQSLTPVTATNTLEIDQIEELDGTPRTIHDYGSYTLDAPGLRVGTEASGDMGDERSTAKLATVTQRELRERSKDKDRLILRVELRQVESSAMVFVQELSPNVNAEYRIENKSVCFKLYYKQKGIVGNSWMMLNPGQSRSYVWEDPFKPHKLLVHSGANILSPSNDYAHVMSGQAGQFFMLRDGDPGVGAYWGYLAGINPDQATVVSFDEIGSKEAMFVSHKTDLRMIATVKSEGPTKILLITPSLDNRQVIRELRYCSEFINEQLIQVARLITQLSELSQFSTMPDILSSKLALLDSQFEDALVRMKEKQTKLIEVDQALSGSACAIVSSAPAPRPSFSGAKSSGSSAEDSNVADNNTTTIPQSLLSYRPIERVMQCGIERQHQLEVRVMEAKELTALVAGKMEDVYCKVVIKSDDLSLVTQSEYNRALYTYICESTLDPTWQEQRFVFNIPEKAAVEQRKYNIRVMVKARSLVGLDSVLGQADIEFSCLKDERVLEGWFPLRAVRSSSLLSLRVSGSIKLRLQWVYSPVGYANYVCTSLEERQNYLKLQYNVQRFSLKHLQKVESNKSLSAKNDKVQQLQLRQAEKDYYELFEALSERERQQASSTPSAFQQYLQQQQASTPYNKNHSNTASSTLPSGRKEDKHSLESDAQQQLPAVRVTHFQEDEKSEGSSDEDRAGSKDGVGVPLNDFISGRKNTRAINELNASSSKKNHLDYFAPIITNGEMMSPPFKENLESNNTNSHPTSINRPDIGTFSNLKRSARGSTTAPTPTASASRFKLSKRGLSSKFEEEGCAANQVVKEMPAVIHAHDQIYRTWAVKSLNNIPIHRSMAVGMDRALDVTVDHNAFCRRFEQECRRSFEHVHTLSGVLEVTPMQALHLPETKNPMLVRVSYGHQRHSTFRLPPASYLTWYQDHESNTSSSAGIHNPDFAEGGNASAHNSYASSAVDSSLPDRGPPQRDNSQNATLAKSFIVDTLNIKGALNVCVMTEGVTKAKEVAKIEIPVFNLLDCCFALTEGQYYDRWFPLIMSSESIPCEGDVDRYMNNILPEQHAYSSFDYQPCIRLRVRWLHSEDRRQIEESRLYARMQIPSISVGLIDSNFAREVMQIAVRGIELRHSVDTDYTDTSLNITGMQVDNQLPDPVSSVILCPTTVKYPQPVVRMHVRKKNLLSQNKLTSYETIQLVVQELDLHLEQQTVVASWELVKSLMQERKYGKRQHQRQSQGQAQTHAADKQGGGVDGATTNMDSLGFASCTALVQYELLPTLDETFRTTSKAGVKAERSADGNKREALLKLEEDVNTLYIEHFEIFPIKFNVSFITTPQILVASNHKKQRESDIRSEGTAGLYSSVSLFLWQVGEVVLDLTSTISDAPIFFHGYEESHVFKTDYEIAKFLQDRYLHNAMWQLYKIVGSLELVGNPIGLLSSLGSGVRDFFYEPARAIIKSPTEIRKIGRGVMKGAVSLVSNTTVGFLGTGITITRSVGRGVAKLSMDSAYMRRREELQRPPATIKAAAKRPFQDVSNGVYYALVGVVKVPMKSVRRRGLIGLGPGVAKGLVGLATNPVVGILDAVAHGGDACRDLLNLAIKESAEPVQRLRLSELFGPDGRILPYNYANALGTQILLVLDRSNEERIKVTNAINSGVGLIKTARALLSRPGDAISMTIIRPQNSSDNNRMSMMGDKRGNLKSGDHTHQTSAKSSMVQRRNRFSFVANSEEESASVLRSDMGMFAHTAEFNPDDSSVVTENEKDHVKGPVVSEFVIYTAVIKQDHSVDLIAILTTERLIVTEYHRRTHSAYIKEQWVAPLSQLLVPIFERSGGKATLLLRSVSASVSASASDARKANVDNRAFRPSMHSPEEGDLDASHSSSLSAPIAMRDTQHGRKSSFLLVANYNEEDVIINLYNTLHTVMGIFEGLMTTSVPEHNDCEEKEAGVVHIGAWQFARETLDSQSYGQSANGQMDLKAAETQNIIKELELEVWVHWDPSKDTADSPTRFPFASHLALRDYKDVASSPYWLVAEQDAAVKSHSNIRTIFDLCAKAHEEYKRAPKSKVLLKVSIQELYKGSIDFDTFLKNTQAMILPTASSPQVSPLGNDDEDSVDTGSSSQTGKKSKKSRFSLFPFGLGGSSVAETVSTGLGITSTPGSVAGEADMDGNAKQRSMIFNLQRGGSKNSTKNSVGEEGSALAAFLNRPNSGISLPITFQSGAVSNSGPTSPSPGAVGEEEDESGLRSAGKLVSSMSERFTAGAMTIGAAALSLPSSLASSIRHPNRSGSSSPIPHPDSSDNKHSAASAALNAESDRNIDSDGFLASTHVPFNLSPMNTVSSGYGSWITNEASSPTNNNPTVDDFVPTKIQPISDTSFTYADLKPPKRRTSPRLGSKNTVRWSTGSLGLPDELETIEEGKEERNIPVMEDPGSLIQEEDELQQEETQIVRPYSSSEDTDDEAMFFDALSPDDAEFDQNHSFQRFSEFDNEQDNARRISFSPSTLAAFQSVDHSDAVDDHVKSCEVFHPDNSLDVDETESTGSVASQASISDVVGVNPMYAAPPISHSTTPAMSALLADSTAAGVHPLFNRSMSFGRSHSFNEGDNRRRLSGSALYRSPPVKSSVARIFSDEFGGSKERGTRRSTGGILSPPHYAQSPEIAVVVDRLDRLESLLERALNKSQTFVSSARQQSGTGYANESEDIVNNGDSSMHNQLNFSEMANLFASSAAELVSPLLEENLPLEITLGTDESAASLPNVDQTADAASEVLLPDTAGLFDNVSQSPINNSRSSSVSNLDSTVATDAAEVPMHPRTSFSSSIEGDGGVSSGKWTPVSASSSHTASSAMSIISPSAVPGAQVTEDIEHHHELVASSNEKNNEIEFLTDDDKVSVSDALEERDYASQSSDGPAVPRVATVVLEGTEVEERPELSLLEGEFPAFEDSYEESSSRRLDAPNIEHEDNVQKFQQERDSFADEGGMDSEREEPATPNGRSNLRDMDKCESSDEDEFEGIHAHLALQRLSTLRNNAAQSPFLSILEATAPKNGYEIRTARVVTPKTAYDGCIEECSAEDEEMQEDKKTAEKQVEGNSAEEWDYATPLPVGHPEHEHETAALGSPDSPTVADLIDHFSPMLSRSVNRESRRLSKKDTL